MPYAPQGVTVEPNAQTVVVTITEQGGGTPTVYTDRTAQSTIAMPATITGRTTFYLTDNTTFTVSCKVGGLENANGNGGTAQVDLTGGGFASLGVSVPVETPGVTSGTYVPAKIIQGAGIDPTGAVDSTAAIQALLNAGGSFVFPAGKSFKVSSLALVNGTRIVADGATITGTTTTGGILTGSALTNLALVGGTWVGANTSVAALALTSCSQVTVRNIVASTCTILSTGSSTYAASNATDNQHILVQGCRAVGASSGGACILFQFASDCAAVGNDIDGYGHGIQWWGGDSNTNGATTNARKAVRIRIVGNRVKGQSGGGIWGSMGSEVAVLGNTVSDCGDVGIDVEGSFYVTVAGNTVARCVNANLSMLFLNRAVIFSGNSVYGDATHTTLVHVTSTSQDIGITSGNRDVVFVGNTFDGAGTIAALNVAYVNTVTFEANKFIDAKLNCSGSHRTALVYNNTFNFSVAAGAAMDALAVNGLTSGDGGQTGTAQIAGNTIGSTVGQPASSRSIVSSSGDFNGSPIISIRDNIMSTFPVDINVLWSGTNAGTTAQYDVRFNRCGSGTITATNTGATAPNVVKQGNTNFGLVAI